MRVRAVFVAGVASLSVLGIGWQLGSSALDANHSLAISAPATAGTVVAGSAPVPTAPSTPSTSSSSSSSTSTSASSSASASASAAAAATAAAQAASAAQSGTFTGSVVQTQFGSVQVSVTIAGGAITEVTPLQLTNRGGRSVSISNQAAPILRSEVLTAQSARVQNVGGATYTTYGYLTSLQAALDAAQF